MSDDSTPDDPTGTDAEASEPDLPGLEHGSARAGSEPDDPGAAERAADRAPDVSDAYDEALERGAEVEGEGAIVDVEGQV